MTENNEKMNNARHDDLGLLRKLRKSVIIRAALALAMIVLTLILLFSLTLAWYTNVVQTGGLVFETEQWDFDGTITLQNKSFVMSPGNSGVIPLTIENKGNHIVAASVTVSKQDLQGADVTINGTPINPYELMQKRLYFYVDTMATRHQENMERVYVSDKSSYTYTVFPQSTMVLNENGNAALLKWEWVYDVLGYYVWGEATADANNPSIYTDVTPQYYIRPIEYDFDEMTTTFDGEQLATIDGSKTALEFLKELTAADGYRGSIAEDTQAVNGYYPISVDNNGRGVWLRLCTYSEIQQNMKDDALLGSLPADQITYRIKVNVTGQNSREDETYVQNVAGLIAALQDPTAGIVTLSDDIALSDPIELASGTSTILNLNGKTLSTTAANMFVLQKGANLAVSNGTLSGVVDNKTVAVYAEGAHVMMSDVTVSNVYQGFVIKDHLVEGSSVVKVSGSTIDAAYNGIHLYGNADASASRTVLIVDDSTVVGAGYAGICCNGSYRATDITVKNNSKVTGYWTAIYHPQKQSTMTITSSTLEGWTALVVKGGTVTVNDSLLNGTGETHSSPAYHNSGFSDTGDGIYLEGGYDEDAAIYINGANTKVSSTATESLAVRHYFEENGKTPAIYITGGTYSTDVTDYCADGYECIANGDGSYTVQQVLSQS